MIVYKGRLLKQSSIKNRSSSCQAFHMRPIWSHFFVAIDSESYLTLFPSLCAPPSEVAALFKSNLSRHPFLREVVDLDLLLCKFAQDSIRNLLFLSYVIFLLTDQWLIEKLSKAMGVALNGNNFSPIPSKISFHIEKRARCCPRFTKH